MIKPNLVTSVPSGTGQVTDVRVVKAVVRLVHEAADGEVEIIVGDGCPEPMDYGVDFVVVDAVR